MRASSGVALKDRAAILMAGRKADAALWFDQKQARFVTSSYYPPHPELLAFNDGVPAFFALPHVLGALGAIPPPALEGHVRSAGALSLQEPAARVRRDVSRTRSETRKPSSRPRTATSSSSTLARSRHRGLRLGSRADGAGSALHRPLLDGLLRPPLRTGLEGDRRRDGAPRRDARRFFSWLDERSARDRSLVFLTADHGVTPIPEVARARYRRRTGNGRSVHRRPRGSRQPRRRLGTRRPTTRPTGSRSSATSRSGSATSSPRPGRTRTKAPSSSSRSRASISTRRSSRGAAFPSRPSRTPRATLVRASARGPRRVHQHRDRRRAAGRNAIRARDRAIVPRGPLGRRLRRAEAGMDVVLRKERGHDARPAGRRRQPRAARDLRPGRRPGIVRHARLSALDRAHDRRALRLRGRGARRRGPGRGRRQTTPAAAAR